jgi:hypothetical protein
MKRALMLVLLFSAQLFAQGFEPIFVRRYLTNDRFAWCTGFEQVGDSLLAIGDYNWPQYGRRPTLFYLDWNGNPIDSIPVLDSLPQMRVKDAFLTNQRTIAFNGYTFENHDTLPIYTDYACEVTLSGNVLWWSPMTNPDGLTISLNAGCLTREGKRAFAGGYQYYLDSLHHTNGSFLQEAIDSLGHQIRRSVFRLSANADDYTANCIAPTQDGGTILAGQGGFSGLAVKADQNGIHVWHSWFSNVNPFCICEAILELNNGTIITAAHGIDYLNDDFELYALNATGTQRWVVMPHAPNGYYPFKLIETREGNILVGGINFVYTPEGVLEYPPFLASVTQNGTVRQISRPFVGDGHIGIYTTEFLELPDSTIIIAGEGYPGYFVARYTPEIFQPHVPQAFSLLQPSNATRQETDSIIFRWNSAYDADIFDMVSYTLRLWNTNGQRLVPDIRDTTYIIERSAIGSLARDSVYWQVTARSALPDTLIVSNDTFVFFYTNSISDGDVEIVPSSFNVSIFPNPFNGEAQIALSIDRPGFVQIKAYDVLGRCIEILSCSYYTPGNYRISWIASNLPSGVLFFVSNYNDQTKIAKAVLLR